MRKMILGLGILVFALMSILPSGLSLRTGSGSVDAARTPMECVTDGFITDQNQRPVFVDVDAWMESMIAKYEQGLITAEEVRLHRMELMMDRAIVDDELCHQIDDSLNNLLEISNGVKSFS